MSDRDDGFPLGLFKADKPTYLKYLPPKLTSLWIGTHLLRSCNSKLGFGDLETTQGKPRLNFLSQLFQT